MQKAARRRSLLPTSTTVSITYQRELPSRMLLFSRPRRVRMLANTPFLRLLTVNVSIASFTRTTLMLTSRRMRMVNLVLLLNNSLLSISVRLPRVWLLVLFRRPSILFKSSKSRKPMLLSRRRLRLRRQRRSRKSRRRPMKQRIRKRRNLFLPLLCRPSSFPVLSLPLSLPMASL